MKLLTKAVEAKLRKNAGNGKDNLPVLKVFNPCGGQTWLFTELDEDGDTLFGLADLGFGSPELGYVSLAELAAVRTRPFGLPLERDMYFKPKKALSAYAAAARELGRIEA